MRDVLDAPDDVDMEVICNPNPPDLRKVTGQTNQPGCPFSELLSAPPNSASANKRS